MTIYQSVLHELYRKKHMTAEEIAQTVFNGSIKKTYKSMSELQKRRLVTSERVNPEKGGSSTKIYKITTSGVKKILPELQSAGLIIPTRHSHRTGKPENDLKKITPKFPNQSDSMKRQLIIEQLEKNTKKWGGAFLSGKEALEALTHYVARLENVPDRQASRIFQFEMREIVVLPPAAKQSTTKPAIYFIPTAAAGQPYIIERLQKYEQAQRYLQFRVIPITQMQKFTYPKITEVKNMATLIQSETLLPR